MTWWRLVGFGQGSVTGTGGAIAEELEEIALAVVAGLAELAQNAGEGGVMEEEGGAADVVDILEITIDGLGLFGEFCIDESAFEVDGAEGAPGGGCGQLGEDEVNGGFGVEAIVDGLAKGLEGV